MSKLILFTKSGGVPYLNDTLISFLPYCYINVKFSDFVTNLEVIEKYGVKKKNMLSEFFGIEEDKSYVSLYHQSDFKLDLGNGSNEKLNLKANNGKSEIKISQYISSLKVLNPKLAVMPHEPITTVCGKKKIKRNIEKFKFFIEHINELESIQFVAPLFFNNQYFVFSEYAEVLKKIEIEGNRLYGYLLYIPSFNYLSITKIKELKENIDKCEITNKKTILFGNGHPIDILIGSYLGISEFELFYPFELSEKGLILNFSLGNDVINVGGNQNYIEKNISNCDSENSDGNSIRFDAIELNNIHIVDDKFYEEHEVIDKKCKCFTCSNGYTKAYLNHLFKCNELNGNILLLMHNIHKINELIVFFEALKQNEKLSSIVNFIKNNCIIVEQINDKSNETIIESDKKLKKDGN